IGHASNVAGPYRQPDPFNPQVSSESRLSVQADGRDLDFLPAALRPQQGDTVRFELKIGADHRLYVTRTGEYRDGKTVPSLNLGKRDEPIDTRELKDFAGLLLKALLPEG